MVPDMGTDPMDPLCPDVGTDPISVKLNARIVSE